MDNYPKEVLRKTLHLFAVAGIIAWLYAYEDWHKSVLITLVATAIIFPILYLFSKIPGLSKTFNARKPGEYSISFVALSLTYATLAYVCWGIFDQRILAVASILAWGPGDAAAALIGKRYGKHFIGRRKTKTFEGSFAMFVFSFVSVFVVLFMSNIYNLPQLLIVTYVTAVVATVAELKVLSGLDTFFCPVSAMAILCIFYKYLIQMP